jgi:hypothetical protein
MTKETQTSAKARPHHYSIEMQFSADEKQHYCMHIW